MRARRLDSSGTEMKAKTGFLSLTSTRAYEKWICSNTTSNLHIRAMKSLYYFFVNYVKNHYSIFMLLIYSNNTNLLIYSFNNLTHTTSAEYNEHIISQLWQLLQLCSLFGKSDYFALLELLRVTVLIAKCLCS